MQGARQKTERVHRIPATQQVSSRVAEVERGVNGVQAPSNRPESHGESTFMLPKPPLNEMQDHIDQVADMVMNFLENGQSGSEGASKGKKKGSWLMQLATEMGDMLDKKFEEVQESIEAVKKERDDAGPGQVAEMQGHMQEMGFMLTTASTAIKTMGQGANTLAGRQ